MRDNQMINNTIAEKPCNSCLLAYLLETAPDFIQASPRHWLFEDTPSHHGRIIVAVVLLIICLPANITQILIFLSYGRSRSLRTASNRLLISLLLADFLLLFNCYSSIYQAFYGAPVIGVYGCNINGFVGSVAALSEIWSLSAVSFDRFKCVHNPLNRSKRIKTSEANKIIFFIWMISVMFASFPIFGWSQYVSESYLMGCAFDMYSQSWSDRSYGLILCFLCWLFPLSIIFSSYVGILYRTRSSYKNVLLRTKTFRESNSEQPTIRADNETERDLRRKTLSTSTLSTKSKMELFKIQTEENLARRVGSLIFVWFCAWTPYAIMATWAMFFNSYQLSPLMGLIPLIFCKISAGLNVVVYGLGLPHFQNEIKKMIFHAFESCSSINSNTTMRTPSTSPHYSKTMGTPITSPHYSKRKRSKTESTKDFFDFFDKPLLKRHQSNHVALPRDNRYTNVILNNKNEALNEDEKDITKVCEQLSSSISCDVGLLLGIDHNASKIGKEIPECSQYKAFKTNQLVRTIVTIDFDNNQPTTFVKVANLDNECSLLDNLSLKYEDYHENLGSILDLSDNMYSNTCSQY